MKPPRPFLASFLSLYIYICILVFYEITLCFIQIDSYQTFVLPRQVLTILQEAFPAVTAAETAVKLRPLWWEGWQTLGRAQLNLGEVDLVSGPWKPREGKGEGQVSLGGLGGWHV